jgi:hypothetical protein
MAMTIAVGSAADYAGGWNDGSRLATVESLVDRHTLQIDASIFVAVPTEPPFPYHESDRLSLARGTCDKLLIDGRYYSDKSPVPALAMAGVYQLLQWTTGLRAADNPRSFIRSMTLASSGLAFVLAVWWIWTMALHLRLDLAWSLVLVTAFGLGTIALPYSRHVNNHVLLLAAAAGIMAHLAPGTPRRGWWLGTLAGIGYTIDLGAGPMLVLALVAYLVLATRRTLVLAQFALAAFPWFMLHHAVNFAIGGTFCPANAVPQYLNWPGSPFNLSNMTGPLNHGPGSLVVYSLALLFGKRGFLFHNLPLLLALPGVVHLLRCRIAERSVIAFSLAWCVLTWLVYSVASTNYSGACCSIRWFVPLLAPGFFLVALTLRNWPDSRPGFVVLTIFGVFLMAIAWRHGPWIQRMVPGYWPLVAEALICWGTVWTIDAFRRSQTRPMLPAQRHIPGAIRRPRLLSIGKSLGQAG